jgi:protein involved in polysaccharide export with SLBB domain
MILKGWIPALGLFVLTSMWSGCHIFTADRPPGHHPCVDDVIRIGDTLTISLLDIPDPKTDTFLVGSDGTVNVFLLGSIVATNKKFGVFEKEIQNAYLEKKYYSKVKVVVKPGDRFYTVGGEVNAKGRQFYLGQTTVLRAIVSCGDFTDFANRRRVEILRADGTREVMDCIKARSDQRYDRPICPGDAIFVPRSL